MVNFEIGAAELEAFNERGYIRFKNVLPQDLLIRWQQFAHELEARALQEYENALTNTRTR